MACHGASGVSHCCDNGKCVCCSCVQAGKSCLNYLSSRGGCCSNLISDEQTCTNVGKNHDSTQSDGDENLHFSQHTSGESAASDFERLHFQNAFGAQLLHSEGGSYI